MPTPNNLPEIWPPPPMSGHEPQPQPLCASLRSETGAALPSITGAALPSIAGAVAGGMMLFLAWLVIDHTIGDGTYPLSFLIALAVATVAGAVGGAICGLTVWFASRLILRRRES